VIPVIAREDGMVNLERISLSGSESLTIIAPYGITGLDFGEAFTAGELYIQSETDLHISGSLIGLDLVQIQTSGDLYLEPGALLDTQTVQFISETGSVYGAEGSLITGNLLLADVFGDVSIYSDFIAYNVLSEAGNVWIDHNDYDIAGKGWDYNSDRSEWDFTDKTVDLTSVVANNGTVTVTTGGTMRAYDVAANDITLVARGAGSIEVGHLETWTSSVSLDAARYVRDIPGFQSDVIANDVTISAGLDVTVQTQTWPVEVVNINSNMSLLIDEFYTGPLQIYEAVQHDIIIDTVITAVEGQILLNAPRNIIFTENGGISNSGNIILNAGEFLVLSSLSGMDSETQVNTPVIQGPNVSITAQTIFGGESALISADILSVAAYNGFGLRTEVTLLQARVFGEGDLKIDALTSIVLDGVAVFDGDLEVTSGGAINARNVIIETDSYANRLALSAVGEVAFGGEPFFRGLDISGLTDEQEVPIGRQGLTYAGGVLLGQLVEVDIQAGGGFAAIDEQVVVLTSFADEYLRSG